MKTVKLLEGVNPGSTTLAGYTNMVVWSCAFARFVGSVDVNRDIENNVRASSVDNLYFSILFFSLFFQNMLSL